jgi:RNA ligase
MLFYKFPEIAHINDVLPHIEGREEFTVNEKDGYTVIDYMVAFEETFKWSDDDRIGSAIRRECRGLVFNENGELISRPYSKFFNVGEKEETQIHKINLQEPHVILEKLDGSMVRPIPTKDGFRLGTRAGVTEISQQAEEFIADKPHYSTFINKCIQKGTTPIFEWCSRKNRIVIDYPEDQLILTAIRYLDTGTYVWYDIMKRYAETWNIPVVKVIAGDSKNIEEIVYHIRKWQDSEGVVNRFDTGHMLKIKADDYVLRHKAKESINFEKNVIKIILDDYVDDVIPLLHHNDADRLRRFQVAFWESVNDFSYEMAQLFIGGNRIYPDKKDFAVEFVQKKVPSNYMNIMYGMKSGRGSTEIILDMIGNSLTSQTKVDKNRWLWKNLNWNLENYEN